MESTPISTSSVPYGISSATDIFGLIEWVNQNDDGFFNPKQRLQRSETNAATAKWMLLADDDIQEGEILATIPWDLMIKPDDFDVDEFSGELDCQTVSSLATELGKKEHSDFAPLVTYYESLTSDKIPSLWSYQGKELLLDILDAELPPGDVIDILNDEWLSTCEGSEDDSNTAGLVMQHGFQKALVMPIYDWYTHRNGKFLNVEAELTKGKHLQMVATRNIKKGEALHQSNDLCKLCNEEAVEDGYGTAGKFKTYCEIRLYS